MSVKSYKSWMGWVYPFVLFGCYRVWKVVFLSGVDVKGFLSFVALGVFELREEIRILGALGPLIKPCFEVPIEEARILIV